MINDGSHYLDILLSLCDFGTCYIWTAGQCLYAKMDVYFHGLHNNMLHFYSFRHLALKPCLVGKDFIDIQTLRTKQY